MILSAEEKHWADETWLKITNKMEWLHKSSSRNSLENPDRIFDWTNGFWPGMLWLLYKGTNQKSYRSMAEILENEQTKALLVPEMLHHDVGFMWGLTSIAGYRLCQDEGMRQRGLAAANYLLSRFQYKGNYIVAWKEPVHEGWSIIDTMMNLPLLFWASEETGLSRYRDAAIAHADKTLENMVRSDGSVCHIISYDTQNGDKLEEHAGQGYKVGSSWTRGIGWAIYGFALAYQYTKEQRYIDVAKRTAHYFLSCVSDDYIPPIDFRQPLIPDYRDASAGAIAACGLLRISELVDDCEKSLYTKGAMNLLKALESTCCDWSREEEAILLHSSMAYHWGTDEDKDTHLIYGDYFFIEAVLTLRGMDLSFW